MSAAPAGGGGKVEKVQTYCYQCVAGPDLMTVKVVDGVATEIEPNFKGPIPTRPRARFASRRSD